MVEDECDAKEPADPHASDSEVSLDDSDAEEYAATHAFEEGAGQIVRLSCCDVPATFCLCRCVSV